MDEIKQETKGTYEIEKMEIKLLILDDYLEEKINLIIVINGKRIK